MDELLTLRKKEITRVEVTQRIEEKRLKQREGAKILGISDKQAIRSLA